MTSVSAVSSVVARFWRSVLVVSSIAWLAAIMLAPFAAHAADLGRLPLALAYGAYAIGHVVCHQLPERSFHLMATPLPVCARCTGIYAGAAAALLAPAVGDARERILGRARLVLIAAAIPTVATLLYEWLTGDTPANWMRAAAGVPLGAAVAWIIREVN